MVAVFYFFCSRPNSAPEEVEEMVNELKTGDKVITNGSCAAHHLHQRRRGSVARAARQSAAGSSAAAASPAWPSGEAA